MGQTSTLNRLRALAPPQVEVYGAGHWYPGRDLSFLAQNAATGLWAPGKGRRKRRARCSVCGGVPGQNEYCEGCSRAGVRYRGPWQITTAQEDPADTSDPSDRTGEAVRQSKRPAGRRSRTQ